MRAELALATAAMTGSPGDALLESTFDIPDQPGFMVDRPRLLDALRARTDLPITLMVGPAGSGKTQLAAAWARARTADATVAWLTLHTDDGHASAFWTYVVSALHRAGVPLSAAVEPVPSPAPVDRSFLLLLAAELAGQRTPVLLVLDGVSAVEGERWAADLEFVLRHAGGVLRLVLTGRWDPPLPLHRYRLAGRLAEIRSGDLAFTAGEAAQLLTLHGVELSPAGLGTLLAHTEGWAAGIRLFAMALQDHGDADRLVNSITGNEATIAEYFVDEVLRAQPAHVRAFLLDTSVLETFTPDLAEAVTGRADARRLLAQLARRNAFVRPVTEHSAAYRFHRLFAELLRAQLMCERPQRPSDLHRRAANWLSARGRTVEAVGHAVRARDWPLAATIAVEHHAVGRLVTEGRHGRLGALLAVLPDDCDSAEVSVVTAALALAGGSVEGCARQLARAQLLVIQRDWDYSPALALADSILGVLLVAARGDHAEVLALSPATEQALARTPREVHTLHPELCALVTAARGIAHSHVGAVDAAVASLTEVIAETAPACRGLGVDCRQHLALIEVQRGRLRPAERLADEAVDAAQRYGREPSPAPALARAVLAWVALERNDPDAAERHLLLADGRRPGATAGVAAAACALVRSRRLQDRGDLRGAVSLIEETFAATAPALPGWLARELTVTRGHLMVVAGRPDRALAIVDRFARPHPPEVVVLHAEALVAAGDPGRADELLAPLLGSATGDPSVRVRAWLARARAAQRLGDDTDTRNALRHALRAAAPQGQRRAVRLAWDGLRAVVDDGLAGLYRALQDDAPAARRRVGRTPDSADLVIVEALSRRELQVLQGMAAMTPTEEIAATLNVSVNTVKTHVRSILRKLSASRRNEAVRRARSLGLIADLSHPGGTR